MNDIDLSGDITLAINGAFERGHPITIAYVDESERPSLSIRGSTQVLNAQEVGIWARSRDKGLAKAIETNPNVGLIFFGNLPDGSKMMLNLAGRAHADVARNSEVYDGMNDIERKYDPDAAGIAVIVRIDAVSGMTADGKFSQG